MSEATDKAVTVLTGLIEKAAGGLDSAVEFSQAQIPDVVEQLLLWNSVASIGTQIVSLMIIIICIFMIISSFKSRVCSEGAFLIIVVYGIILVISLAVFFCNFDWLKIWLAPKLYLLEYAASLVK